MPNYRAWHPGRTFTVNLYQAHMDYVHINPLKHGLVRRVVDWPHSTFHRLVAISVYPVNWAREGLAESLNYRD